MTTYYQAEGSWWFTPWLGFEFEVEGGQIIGNNHAENLSASIGSAYKLNELLEEPELNVPNLFLAGRADGGVWRWRLGKLGLQSVFDDNRVARQKRTTFLSQPFARNPAVPFPAKGLGGSLRWTPVPRAALALGVSDGNAVSTKSGLTTLRGQWFTGAELTLRPARAPADAAMRVLTWRTTRRAGSDGGWAVSTDAAIAPGVVAFARLGNGSTRFARVHGLVAGGLAWEGIPGRKNDFLGVALSRGMSVVSGREEILAEAVYRWQVNRWLAFSPDVQWIRHPARSRAEGAWLFGLRCAIMHTR